MDLQVLLKQITQWQGSFPEHDIAQLVDNEAEAKPLLRALLQETLKNYKNLPEGYIGHIYAFYMLAFFRDPAGFVPALQFLSLPGTYPEKMLGHFLTQSFSQVIASCYDGHLEPLLAVIENQECDSLYRIVALVALTILYHTKKVERSTIVTIYSKLLQSNSNSTFLAGLAEEIADLHLRELKVAVIKLYQEGKIVSDGYTEKDFCAVLDSGYSNPRKFFLIEDVFFELNGSEYSGE